MPESGKKKPGKAMTDCLVEQLLFSGHIMQVPELLVKEKKLSEHGIHRLSSLR